MYPPEEKKYQERRVIGAVAAVLGGRLRVDPDPNGWPDGWIETDTERIPAEVVDAVRRAPDEDPRQGSRYARAWQDANRQAQAMIANDKYPLFGVDDSTGKPFVMMPEDGPLPVSTLHLRKAEDVIAAVRQKVQKRYATADKTILVIHYQSPFSLSTAELRQIADAARADGSRFRAIWIVNAHGDPPQRVPLP